MRKVGTAPDKLNFKVIYNPAKKQKREDIYTHLIGLCYSAPLKPAVSYSVFLNKLYTQALTFWCLLEKFPWTHMLLGWWSTWKI